MKRSILLMTILISGTISIAQNVGIGTLTPTDARLHVVSPDNTTQAMFSNGTSGIAFLHEDGRPSIGLNMYMLSGGYKFKGNGFASLFYYRPFDGSMTYYSSSATGVAGGTPAFSSIITFNADGNVGIGTTSPTEAKLQVHEPAGNTQFIAAGGSNLPGVSTFVPSSAPSIGFNVRYQSGYKFMGAGYGGFFEFSPTLGRLRYYYTSTKGVADGAASPAFAMSIDSSGRIGFGVQSPLAPLHVNGNVVFASSLIEPAAGYRLSVDGKIICEELKVQLQTAWPDYVFEKEYEMPSLLQLEQKVMTEKHLPGIPSASDVKAQQGFEMGDMQKRMLEKLEEAYRYMFELNNENKKLREELNELKKKVQ